jgi:hypothetical protein
MADDLINLNDFKCKYNRSSEKIIGSFSHRFTGLHRTRILSRSAKEHQENIYCYGG